MDSLTQLLATDLHGKQLAGLNGTDQAKAFWGNCHDGARCRGCSPKVFLSLLDQVFTILQVVFRENPRQVVE
jgi:hypothetical protein